MSGQIVETSRACCRCGEPFKDGDKAVGTEKDIAAGYYTCLRCWNGECTCCTFGVGRDS